VETKNRQKILLITAAAVVLLFVGDMFVFEPLVNSWTARSAEIKELRQQVEAGEQMVKSERSIRGHWDIMQTNTLPANTSLAEAQLQKSFARWERASGVTRISLKPQWKQPEDDYMMLECRADYTGDMNRLLQFLYEVEKDPLGLKVDNVEISSRDENGRQLSLGLQISGLMLGTNQPAQQP
jgi:hypothetical protein